MDNTSEAKPKLVSVFYHGQINRIKVFDGTSEDQIIHTLSKLLHIDSESNDIRFQDREGDLMVFPTKIPDELCVYLWVEPKNASIQNDFTAFYRAISYVYYDIVSRKLTHLAAAVKAFKLDTHHYYSDYYYRGISPISWVAKMYGTQRSYSIRAGNYGGRSIS